MFLCHVVHSLLLIASFKMVVTSCKLLCPFLVIKSSNYTVFACCEPFLFRVKFLLLFLEEPGTQGLFFARLEEFHDRPIENATSTVLGPPASSTTGASVPSPEAIAPPMRNPDLAEEARQLLTECTLLVGYVLV